MPLEGNLFHLAGVALAIRHLDRREDRESRESREDRSGIGYRSWRLEDLVERVEGEYGDRDALEGFDSSDALFGFAIRAMLDQQARRGRLGGDRVWRRLLAMGLEAREIPDWEEGEMTPMHSIRYAAVIANDLMRHQEGLEDRVRVEKSVEKSD